MNDAKKMLKRKLPTLILMVILILVCCFISIITENTQNDNSETETSIEETIP